jgi:hypothetical protein
MKNGFVADGQKVNERIRLAEFSLLLASLGIAPSEFAFISHEAQGGYQTDIEAIRTLTSGVSNRQDRVVAAYLPSFKNHFPETLFVEQIEESDHHPGVMEDKYLEFWSAFDTVTYRFWIQFHILKLRMLFCIDDSETELLLWERFGGELPSLGREDRRFLLLLRLFAPFFRGRRMLYERVLPAFLKKEITVEENIASEQEVPIEYQCKLGSANSYLGRDFFPGARFTENFSTFRINVNGLKQEDIADFAPLGHRREVVDNLIVLFAPAHLRSVVRYNFVPGIAPFVLGAETKTAYLGLSTFLRGTG